MIRTSHVFGRGLLSLAVLALPFATGCTEHRSIFGDDGGVPDAGEDAGVDGGSGDAGIGDGGVVGSPVSIHITGLSMGPIAIGATVALHVVAVDAAGAESDVTAESTLTSSNPMVASIANDVLTANARGMAVIRASLPVDGGMALQASAPVQVANAMGMMTQSVQVTPATLSLAPGLGAQLAANATQGDGTQLTVTTLAQWSSSDATVCTVGNNQDKGFVTAVAVGSCTVTAAFGGKQGAAAVSVQQLSIVSLTVTPASASIAAGATVQLAASATLSDGTIADATRSATWTTSDATKATVQAGLVIGAAPGSATITAALDAVSAPASITVTAATLSSISVAPPQSTLAAGLEQQLSATALYSDGTTADVTQTATWTSDTPAVAALESATPGLVDALSAGRVIVSATVGSSSGTAIVDVTSATAVSLTLIPSPITLPAGVSQQVIARAVFTDNSVRDVSSDATWSLGDPTLATVSATGLVTGTTPGMTTLTATLGSASATAALTVTAAQLVQILLLPQESSVDIGGTQQLTATGIYGDNSLHDVTGLVTWSSSSAATASVSNAAGARGLATGVAAGTAQITAAIGGVTSSPASITVSAAALVSIALTPRQILTAVYITVPTQVTARYADGSQIDVTAQATFTSSNSAIATVVAAGTDAGEVTGAGQGQASITASFGGQTSTAQVTVAAATLQAIDIAPPRNGIETGQSVQLQAMAQFQGTPVAIDVTALVAWSSSDPTVGTFLGTPNGLFIAEGAGTTTVAAELDGISGTRAITVSSTLPVSIAVVEASFTLPVGVTKALIAVGTYADGSAQDLTYGAAWSSDANAVAVVGNTGALKGLVTGVSAGMANISATLAGITGTAVATVGATNAVSVQVTPIDPTVTQGNGGGGGPGGGFRPTANYPFYATALFDDGTYADVTQSCVWTSSDPSVATISDETGSKGEADIIATGGTTITATFRGLTDSTQLTSR